MKPEELRIGNLFQDQKREILEVVALEKDEISFQVKDRSKYPVKYKWQAQPIPLSPEWLKRFGFEGEDFQYFKKDSRYFIEKMSDNQYEVKLDYYKPGENHLCIIQHVHQLQNLYYALCGQELIIEK